MDSARCAPRVVDGNDAHDDAEKPVRPRLSLDGLHADVLAQIVDACDHRSRLALLRTNRTLSTFADEALLAVVSLGMRHAADGLIDALERRPERASRLRELIGQVAQAIGPRSSRWLGSYAWRVDCA